MEGSVEMVCKDGWGGQQESCVRVVGKASNVCEGGWGGQQCV